MTADLQYKVLDRDIQEQLDKLSIPEFIDTTPDIKDCIQGERDWLGMPIFGRITDKRNIKILQKDIDQERKSNDPTIAYKWVAEKYIENEKTYGQPLYEAELDLVFIDVDVFRQAALYFKEFGRYCPFHPDHERYEYDLYWDLQEYRRRNGMTAWAGLDKEGNRRLVHIPGNYYGFLNFAPINRVEDDDDAITNEHDFEEESESEMLEQLAEIKLEDLIKNLGVRRTKIGKKTVDFPAFFEGQYHLFIAKNFARLIGKNFFFAKARRKGCSYINAWDNFNHIDLNPYISVILAAYDKKYLTQGKGLMKMLYTYADFINQFTDWAKSRSAKNKEHLRFGYYLENGVEELGYRSEALAVSAMNNPDVTIGKDVYELDYEEMGKFPNWGESYEVTTSTAEAGSLKTGMIVGWGTGGTDEANWKDFETVFYNPRGYDALACNNIWDEGAYGKPCCYFYPHIQSLEGCIDYNGNTDYRAAWIDYLTKKKTKEEESKDQSAFEKWCGQRANSPLEAFASGGTNIFDKQRILRQINKIKSGQTAANLARCGRLERIDNKVTLVTNQELQASGLQGLVHDPVMDFPLRKTTDVTGCFVEWFPPHIDPATGVPPKDMYIAFQDPYAHDKDTKDITIRDSLGATYVYENINNISPHGGGIPVAAYVGRPGTTDEYNQQVELILERYNCKLAFENDRGDTKAFMQKRKKLHWLFEEPELQYDKDIQGKTGRGYGINMTTQRRSKGAVYLRDLLNTPLRKDSQGNEKTLIDYIYDLGLLHELLKWSLTGNFDRVSAWLVGTFYIKEMEYKEINTSSVPTNNNSIFNRPHF